MPQEVDVPFTGPAFADIDADVLDTFSPEVRNAYINEAAFTQKRPGLLELANVGSNPIDGIHWWDNQQVALIVSGGLVWKMTDRGGTVTLLTATEVLAINTPTTFDGDGTRAYLANGGKIVSTTLAGPAIQMVDLDAPQNTTHVAFLDQYLLANDAGGTWGFSEVTQPDVWRAIDRFTAEARPDNLLALHVGQGEIVLFGSQSVEFWFNDGKRPFSNIGGTTLSRGLGAKYSPVFIDDRWIFLDNNRKLVMLEDRKAKEVSLPFNRVLQSLGRVSDGIGKGMTIEGLPLYVLSFPTDKRTFVYNVGRSDWSEWDYWQQSSGRPTQYLGRAYAYAEAWNLHLIGDRTTGKVYTANFLHPNDNGDLIRMTRRTGMVTHGTLRTKISRELIIRMTRGHGTVALPAPRMALRWRNEKGPWSGEHYGSVGLMGDHTPYVRFKQLGRYRTRQYELIYTDDTPLMIAGAKEVVEFLPQ